MHEKRINLPTDGTMKYVAPLKRIRFPTFLAIFSIAVIFHTSSTGAFVSSTGHSLQKSHSRTNTMRFSKTREVEGEKSKSENAQSNLTQQEFQRVTWNPLRLLVLKLGFTEPAWTSPLNYGKRDGVYNCAYCGLELFDTDGYYNSGSGWPSFWRSIKDGHIKYKMEWDGRLECQCGRCSSHLGHVFLDGPLPKKVPKQLFEAAPPSDPRGRRADGYLPRFCINGASLLFNKRGEEETN